MASRRSLLIGGFVLINLLVLLKLAFSSGPSFSSRDTVEFSPTEFANGYLKSGLSGDKLENATFVALCRNEDLGSMVTTISTYEDRFNRKYGYDWVFLNNEEFSDEFIKVTQRLVSGRARYGVIPKDHWSYPDWIDQSKAAEGRDKLEAMGVIYGGSESYRHMCRYESGFFYRHPLMLEYKYYWRVEPDTKIFCDLQFDVFRYMRENDLKYGFTLALYEFHETIPTLWESTLKWIQMYPEYVHPDNLGRFVTEDQGRSYNGCHFWTNLEIADADFWRGEAYSNYFDYLDRLGGFFYERWGDAPVHSIAASLLLKRDQVAHLDFIGYNHPPFQHVPINFLDRNIRCAADPSDNLDWGDFSCLRHFYTAQDDIGNIPAGVPRVLY